MQLFKANLFEKVRDLFFGRTTSPATTHEAPQGSATCCCTCGGLRTSPISPLETLRSDVNHTRNPVAGNNAPLKQDGESAALEPSSGGPTNCDLPNAGAPAVHDETASIVHEPLAESEGEQLDQSEYTEDAASEGDVVAQDEAYWTPKQLQKIRDTQYRTFCGEDETDYTKGPSRIVLATDGVEDCTALLLTLPFSQAVQTAVNAQRSYNRFEHAATAKLAALGRFKFAIKAEIRNHESHIATLKDAGPEVDQDKIAILEEEMASLALMLDENQVERSVAENNLAWQGDMLRDAQAQLTAMLEESWTDAQLLKAEQSEPEASFPEYDLETEYQAFCAKMQAYDTSLMEMPALDTSRDHLEVDKCSVDHATVEESRRLHAAVIEASDRVQAAQAAFDGRDEARVEAQRARNATIEQGGQPEDATTEAFDIRWHQHERDLTHELIEAEATYQKAAEAAAAHTATANAAAADEDEDEEKSELLGDDDSGYAAWLEPRPAGFEPTPRIEEWLATLPDESLPYPDPVEHDTERRTPDAWDAEELAFGEGISTIESNEERKKSNRFRAQIAEWQQVQRRLATEFGRTEQ